MSMKYIQADSSGWLLVRKTDTNDKVSLPHYLKVDYLKTEPDARLDRTKKRDFFKALEGSYKGVNFSVALKSDGSSYLFEGKHLAAGKIKFNRRTEQLWYGEDGPIDTITDPDNPIPLGTYDLEIPDAPHSGGNNYTNQSSYATVWFRIRPGGDNTSVDRYLHTGRISAGCVTMKKIEKWTDIFNYLINRRKNDVSVGTIEVVE